MDGPKLFLFGHTSMQPHFYILLPFVHLKKMEAQQANKNQGSETESMVI